MIDQLKPISSEGSYRLSDEDKWFALNSWAQALAESDDPITLLKSMEDIDKMSPSYPLTPSIINFIEKNTK